MKNVKICMIGASGEVGSHCLQTLLEMEDISACTLLGRRKIDNITDPRTNQYVVDLSTPADYERLIIDHDVAICTLGVGQPSKMSKEDFVAIDKMMVLKFAQVCKQAGVKHFQLLSSVGVNSSSSSFYLRTKGELVEELVSLEFDLLSIFKPSMILTDKNRYGLSQGIILKLWPIIDKLFIGSLKSYKGVKSSTLGASIAINSRNQEKGVFNYVWRDFHKMVRSL